MKKINDNDFRFNDKSKKRDSHIYKYLKLNMDIYQI